MRYVIYGSIVLVILWGLSLVYQSYSSRKIIPKIGLINSKLNKCSKEPNCVSSFSEVSDKVHYYIPFTSDNISEKWIKLSLVLAEFDIKVVTRTDNYIYAMATTRLFRFVDDLEFLLDNLNNTIHIRSSARIGYTDMGKNRKRMDSIFSRL